MPLVRFELKNEYGLGDPRLYQGAPKEEEDPRNILGGVTVSGLVGILRQLGDLAELAAVVFHDVHQQVMTTAARGYKVLNRIQRVEATLPQFEKAVQEQKSHIHFAYIAGCDWHANIQTGQSQLFFSDLPEFMLDSYEECRDPPRLHLLDKFDRAGSGACLKRYSDPSYFQMLMESSDSAMAGKAKSGLKVHKKKKQRSRGMHGLARRSVNMNLHGRSSIQFESLVTDGLSFSVDDASISDTLSISGITTELAHLGSDKRSGFIEVQNLPSSRSTDAETTEKVDYIFKTSNRRSEMDNQENVLLETIRMAAPSTDGGQISELTSQLNKHMDATDALDSMVKTNSGCHTGREVILLPHLNYNGAECVIDESLASGISDEACTSLKKKFSLQVIFDKLQSSGPAESVSMLPYSVENAVSESLTYDNTMKNDSERIHRAPCLGVVVPITQAVAIVGIPPEYSSSQDSFGDNSAKTVSEKEVLFEHRTKQKMKSIADSNCLGTESHYSTEMVVAASKLDCPDSETRAVSCSSDSCPGAFIPSTQAVVIDDVPPEESFSKDYFSGSSARTASEKEVFCKRQTKQETESTDDSNCQGNEYQSSMENVIASSKLDVSYSETHVAFTNSDPCPGFVFPSTQAVVIDGIPPEQSLSQDSLNDISAKTASEKAVLCECQTKQGKESLTNSNCQGTEYQVSMEKVITASKFDVPNSETLVASSGSSDTYVSPILCGLIISNSVDNISSSTLSSDVTSSRSPINISSPRKDSEDSRGHVSSQLANKLMILSSDHTAATTVSSQAFDSFRKSSINIWTNGGLLGLEPSKPPDISVPNPFSSDDIYDNKAEANSQPCVFDGGNESRKLFFAADKLNQISVPEPDNIMGNISDEPSDSILSKQASSFCEIAKVQNAYFSEIDGIQGKKGDTISSGADIYTKNGPESTVSRQNNIDISVGYSSLAHRFLLSSLQRKKPMHGVAPLFELMNNDVHKLHGTKFHSKDKERPKLAISLAPLHKLGNKEDSAHGFSEKLSSPSFDSSGYQSPLLEHMKASFQPINDSDVSKLNLDFLSSQHQGNIGNAMFPSFQLLTQSFQPLLDGALESDDDTFCRSCPYSSDDLLTLHSESDAEIWGEDELDISCRIEATGSISKFQ